jgi:hypothetical protein
LNNLFSSSTIGFLDEVMYRYGTVKDSTRSQPENHCRFAPDRSSFFLR